MSKPHWDALVEQLQDPEPKARRRACQQLARLDDPKAIPFLRTAYLQEDDERVRQAAAKALAAYKALQSGQPVRRLPFSDALLGRIAAGLLILLAASLILHGAVKVLESRDDGEEAEPADDVQTEPLDRDVLVSRLEAKFQEIEQIASGLRGELDHYHATGEIACGTSRIPPEPAALALIDQQVYRDLGLIGSKLDGTLPPLQIAQLRWGRVCETKNPEMQAILETSSRLDLVQSELGDISGLLQRAITDPAPTIGPTVTPAPAATLTLPPGTPTAPPTDTPEPTLTGIPTATATPTITPTATPSPTATLPFPNLDYRAIIRALDEQFVVLGDLENPYESGMVNRWRQAREGQQPSTSFCTFDEWPVPFALTEAQQAELGRPGVADPELEQAARLVADGMDLAYQARALFEPSCAAQTLDQTASQGIPLAENAVIKLSEAQGLVDAMRRRP